MEDEWEREIEADDDLDVLFVAYDPKQVTLDRLIEKAAEFQFDAKVKK